jgi:hypothetical protein
MGRKGVGSLRRGQVVTSFGPGATIDLPDRSVIVGGLDWWRGWDRERIIEPRLEEKCAELLKVPRLALYAPPAEDTAPGAALTGIGVQEFPDWFVADYEVTRGRARSRPLVHRNALESGKFRIDDKARDVTPVRFVMGCTNGHIADIDWYIFTHSGRTACRRQLWLDETGTSGELTDLVARCDCGQTRPLALAKRPDVLGPCDGLRPWLPQKEVCGGAEGPKQMMRLLIRTASNSYYTQRLSVLSLPEASDRIRTVIKRLWPILKAADSVEKLSLIRSIHVDVSEGLVGIEDREAFAYVEAERTGHVPPRRPIKIEEFEALSQAADSFGEDSPEGSFYARRLAISGKGPACMQSIDRVVLVHRLREVSALLGFTRFEAVVPDLQGELDLAVKRAAIAMEPTWLPAVESRGEGVFISFRRDAITSWRQRPEVRERNAQIQRGLALAGLGGQPFDATYVMLHSLAHLLITAVALDCGYNTSSLRERVYVTPQGFGILIYTGTSDAEGTLGGLVQAGRQIDKYLPMALDMARLCSNDPVCAQHAPDALLEERFTLGAACHGCLLISETCCERRNELLDRALLVSTVERLGCEFCPDS